MPQTRSAASGRLERSITSQMRLVTTLHLAGRDAAEDRRRLHDLEVRRALLATARAQRPPAGPHPRRVGGHDTGRGPPAVPSPRQRRPDPGHDRVQ